MVVIRLPGDPSSLPTRPLSYPDKLGLGNGGGGGLVDFSPSERIIRDIETKKIKPPTNIKDLPQQDTFTSTMSVDLATTIGIPIGATDTKLARRVFIQEYLKYVDLEEEDQTVRWGVGVRWIVNYKTLDVQAKTSTIAFVAASAHVGYAEAEARFQVAGLDSAKITKSIPAPVTLNIDTYQLLNTAFMKIKDLIWDKTTTVTPQIVSYLGDVNEDLEINYDESLAICWALTQIKDRRELGKALEVSNITHPKFIDTVKSVYITVANISSPTQSPSPEAQSSARDFLLGFSLKN